MCRKIDLIRFSPYGDNTIGAIGIVNRVLGMTTFAITGFYFNVITNCVVGAVNGFGKPMSAMFLMIFYYIIVRMPLAKILSTNKLEVRGIWIAVLISHIAAAVAGIFYFKVLLKKHYMKFDMESLPNY